MDPTSNHPSSSPPLPLLLTHLQLPHPQHIDWGQIFQAQTPPPSSPHSPRKPQPHLSVPHKIIYVLPCGQLAEVVCVSLEISPTTGLAVLPLRPSKASPGFSDCECGERGEGRPIPEGGLKEEGSPKRL